MEDKDIINLSKSIFGGCLALGTICLLGGVFKLEPFVAAGYMLLIIATPVNLFLVLAFLIHGLVNRSSLKTCIKAIGILSINIPIAILYAVIGICLISDGHW